MTRDPGRVTDGIRSAERGVDSGRDPALIGRNYLAFGVNLTCRGGYPRNRPGMRKVELDYGGHEILQDGLFQGASYYKTRGGQPCLVASISGELFRFYVGSPGNQVTKIALVQRNAANRRRAWMLQAEDWLIVQDGQSRPIFFNGVSARRADDGELPTGCMMEYSMGRVWVVRPGRLSFVAGDLVYGPSGTSTYNYRDAVLKFTENDFLNEGGEFVIPLSVGHINAIKTVPVLDTALGQGPLQVFTDGAVFSVNAPIDRTIWKDLQFPIQTVSLINYGAQSQEGAVTVNGDIWYRSKDGIRSFILAVRRFNEWGNVPMSREMNRILLFDDEKLLGSNSAILFDNRLLMTCSPANSFRHGVYHRGLIALDFDLVSTMGERLPPAYDGLWTGLNVLQVLKGDFNGEDRAFAFVLSQEDKIELWEITKDEPNDNVSNRIQWFFETAALGFQDNGVELKKLETGDMWVDELSGQVDFNVKYRPDQYPGWIDWHSWSECATIESCTLTDCQPPKNLRPQYRPKMRLPMPADSCLNGNGYSDRHAYEFQARVAVTGAAKITTLRLHAKAQEEAAAGECRPAGPCKAVDVCDLPIFSYSAEPAIT